MTDHGILFSAPMVRALIEGRKTQTRRIIKEQPPEWATICSPIFKPQSLWQWSEPEQTPPRRLARWPDDHAWRARFQQGDRLWVRETWRTEPAHDRLKPRDIPAGAPILTMADTGVKFPSPFWGKVRQAIFMPCWASRLTLTVTDVRVQRLQEISEQDCIAEGPHAIDWRPGHGGWMVPGERQPHVGAAPRTWYRCLWDRINGAGSWDANPWVVALTFAVEQRNIDA